MKLILPILFLSLSSLTFSQGITGSTKDEKGNPIAFVTVYAESMQTGTTSNRDGRYEIHAPSGRYTLSFSSIGYKKETREVYVKDKVVTLDIVLKKEVYQIKEVVVKKGSEDPAYSIMRKAIALAPYHLREVDHYKSNTYLRGTVYLDHIPKFISKHSEVKENNKTYQVKSGDVFVEESVIDVEFTAPDMYKRTVRSIRNSLPSGTSNPSNPELIIGSSFYQPQVMNIISPLSPQAFQHYQFRYEGFVQESDNFINKIKVIPRRQSQELFNGYVYIVDGKWCLYTVDLSNSQFWGNLNVKEIFAPLDSSVFMPVSYTFNVDAAMFGIKARFNYGSSVTYEQIHLNPNRVAILQETKMNISPVQRDTSLKEVAGLLSKEDISIREMRKIAKKLQKENDRIPDTISEKKYAQLTKYAIDSMANKRDSVYWNKVRSIPLSGEEISSFKNGPFGVMKSDSSAQKKDSTSVKRKKRNILWPVTGKRFGGRKSVVSFNYKGLIQPMELGFNSVDGVRYGLTSELRIKTDSTHTITLEPWGLYAFSRKAWMWDVSAHANYSKNGLFKVSAGRKDFDFNTTDGMNPFLNSVYSLLVKDNYKKFFGSDYVSAQNEINLTKRIRLYSQVRYERMKELANHTEYSFFNPYHKNYSPNVPPNPDYVSTGLQGFRDFVFDTWITYTPPVKNTKRNPDQSRPTFTLRYTGGFQGIFNSESDFHRIGGKVDQSFDFRYGKKLSYQVSGDYWLSNRNVWFPDYSHNHTSYVPITISKPENTFQLLPYYLYDTNKWKMEAHVKYSTKLLLLKRLPIISNRIWNENVYINYLQTPGLHGYFEAGYTLGQIFAIVETGAFVSFSNGHYHSYGLKLSIALGK